MPLGACEHKLARLTKMRTSQRGCLPHHEQLAGAMNAPVCRAIIYMHFAAIGAECLLCASALRAGPALRMLVQELLGTASAAAWLSHSHPSSFNSGFAVEYVAGVCSLNCASRSSDRPPLDQDARKSTRLHAAPRAATRCGGRSSMLP